VAGLKIHIDIPDRYIKRNIYIFAGLEPVARLRKGKWEVKVSDCSRCGKCCEMIDAENHVFGTENGCKYLVRTPGQQMCGLHIFRPYGCAIADGNLNMGIKECTLKWQVTD